MRCSGYYVHVYQFVRSLIINYRLLTPSTAREAARAWGRVLKEVSKLPSFPWWYLHAAACESRLCFHAGQPVGGGDPSSPLATGEDGTVSVTLIYWSEYIHHYCMRMEINLTLYEQLDHIPSSSILI